MSLDPVKIYLSLRFPKSAKIHEVDGLRTEKRQVLIHIMTLNIMNDTLYEWQKVSNGERNTNLAIKK